MAIPKYDYFFLPLLRLAGDAAAHSLTEAYTLLSEAERLTPEELSELLPSGRQSRFENRVSWALTYLKKAGLVESIGRARFRISAKGLDLLRSNPSAVTLATLQQSPEFVLFRRQRHSEPGIEPAESAQTPEETLEASYQAFRQSLAHEILEKVRTCSPRFFEKVVVDLLLAMGYGGSRSDAGHAVGQSGDGGIDGLIKEDRLGLDAIYVQAKRWDGVVGRPIVQAFAGSLEGQKARKGALMTTSRFSADACEYVDRIEKRIVLIDGEQLADLMIDHGVGVAEMATYVLKKLDTDYFEEG